VQANAEGYLETPISLQSAPPGATFSCQYMFKNTASCGGMGWSATNALTITGGTVQ
jgi:hypothetical protein